KPEIHDEKIRQTASRIAHTVDLFVLAQGSMAQMQEALHSLTGKPVLSSLRSGVESVHTFLKSKGLV
ncbi:MAG: hypothetical protein KA771_05440, partial [Spirochaetales bacterium]|nr:hypothetical protein [Spirochaetales bacterium]